MGNTCGCGKSGLSKEEETSLTKLQGAFRTKLAQQKKEQLRKEELRSLFGISIALMKFSSRSKEP